MLVNIKQILGSDSALTPSSGGIIYNIIETNLSNNNRISLDFLGIEVLTSAFLNAAVGRLYYKYQSSELNSLLSIINISGDDLQLLKKVIERAKDYFRDQKSFNDRLGEALD